MPTIRRPRSGSLQVWPRKRANKFLPSVNWDAIVSKSAKNLKGFICYKAGMASAYVKDNTPFSMTKGKGIAIPVTILECPSMRVFSVRFYKNKKPVTEVFAEGLDKALKSKVKLPKAQKKKIDDIKEEYDDVRLICYSQPKKTGIKRVPDLAEIGLTGTKEEKINFAKEHLNKEIFLSEVFQKGQLVDVRGLSTGKGLAGPVKRFGIGLKSHKSEKGQRNPGSLGPWHPARVTYMTPQAGQLGMFTRAVYNSKIVELGEGIKFENMKNYGNVQTTYMLVFGSVQGPVKRQLLVTAPLRETKKQAKKAYDLVRILK
jgi:large subunit ribosomal protein L3